MNSKLSATWAGSRKSPRCAVSSHGGRGKRSSWSSFLGAPIRFLGGSHYLICLPSCPNCLLKAHHLLIPSFWGWGFNNWVWGVTNIQPTACSFENVKALLPLIPSLWTLRNAADLGWTHSWEIWREGEHGQLAGLQISKKMLAALALTCTDRLAWEQWCPRLSAWNVSAPTMSSSLGASNR